MDSSSSSLVLAPTSNDAISAKTFYTLTWFFFALCNIAFATRTYIRYISFHRLLLEDYLMLVALVLHGIEAVLIQLFVHYAYDIEAVEKGDTSKYGPDFLSNSKKGFVAIGTCINITIIGVFIVKLNFLLFFRRLTTNTHTLIYSITWWAVLLFTVAFAITQIAMQEFGCFFGSIAYIFSGHCTNDAALKRIFFNAIFSATVDAVSDFLILAFPVAILWRSRINLQKKLILTFIFGLVLVTIAITIVRGSIFHDVYSARNSGGRKMQSATFTWFWFYCEFSVAIIVACAVSFRTLFVQRKHKVNDHLQEQRRREAYYNANRRDWRARVRHLHDSVLDTCKSLEDVSEADMPTKRGLPGVPTGLMTVNFNDDTNWSKTLMTPGTNSTEVSVERSIPTHSRLNTPEATYVHSMAR